MKETIVTDVIQLDSICGINTLRKLYKEKQEENFSANNIQCQYKDFTFTINIDDVNIPLKSAGESDTKIIISKPKNLEFNGQPCRTKDNDIEMTIINNGEELQFEDFTFDKLPFDDGKKVGINTSEKTIFDNIVETGITEAFCYDHFDVKGKKTIAYKFPLHYNAHGIFKIPVKENNEPKEITINNMKYTMDNKSAILFKKSEGTSIPYIVIDVTDDYRQRRYFNIINIKDNSNIKALNFVDAKETRITYSENMEFALPKPENKDQLSFFRRFCCCCCDKTNNNKEPELNAKTLHEFKNIENIVTN